MALFVMRSFLQTSDTGIRLPSWAVAHMRFVL